MLRLEDVRLDLPEKENLINGVSLNVRPGMLTVITGPNGGGKTSLAKLIAGLYIPTSGRIFLDDENITRMSITERARKGIAYAFQQPVSFKGITVRKLMQLSAGDSMSEISMCRTLEKVGLCAREYMDREMDSKLSGGEMKRIEIATVLARRSSYIIFDEPEAGIDLWSFSNLIDSFRELKKNEERGLLIISHQERILEIADEIVVISEGLVSEQGTKDAVFPKLLGNSAKGSYCPKGKEMF